jgi:hypothetical protein
MFSSLDKSLPFSLSNVAARQEIASLDIHVNKIIIYLSVIAAKAKWFASSSWLSNTHIWHHFPLVKHPRANECLRDRMCACVCVCLCERVCIHCWRIFVVNRWVLFLSQSLYKIWFCCPCSVYSTHFIRRCEIWRTGRSIYKPGFRSKTTKLIKWQIYCCFNAIIVNMSLSYHHLHEILMVHRFVSCNLCNIPIT